MRPLRFQPRHKIAAVALAGAAVAAGGAALTHSSADAAVIGIDCPSPVVYLADGTFLIENAAGDAGCVTTRHWPFAGAQVYEIDPVAGWTYRIKSNGGATDGSKVEVEFRNTATGRIVKYMIRNGRVIVS